MSHLPRSIFSTEVVSPKERFSTWQESMGVLFDISQVPGAVEEPFFATVDCFHFPDMLLAQTRSCAARYDRKKERVRRDGLDLIMIQLFVEGQVQFGARGQTTLAETGQMVVFDMGQPLENFNSRFENLTLAFPRERIEEFIPDVARWHGHVVPPDQAATRLLRNVFQTSYEEAPEIDVSESDYMEQATLALVAAALNPRSFSEASIDFGGQLVSREIRRFIQRNLSSPSLSVETIVRNFGISRSQLYRHMEGYGGVIDYIRQQRLQRCFRDLWDPKCRHLSISEIAYKWGFNNPGTFARLFRQDFGCSAKAVRTEAFGGDFPRRLARYSGKDVDRRYEEWLSGLSRV